MDTKLVLSDGTELQGSYAVPVGSILWVYCYSKISFGDLFALLNDPEKVAEISMSQGSQVTWYDGFTELFCIRKEDAGFLSAGLRK